MYRLLNQKFITVQDVLAVSTLYQYPLPEQGLNIWGWRNLKGRQNRFDDFITVTDRYFGSWRFNIFPATTSPGDWYLEHLLNPKGAAKVAVGHYKDVYAVGLHKGKEALVQVGPMTVYRSKAKTFETGLYGLNIHRAGFFSKLVGKWSAGCQVFQREEDFVRFISLVKGFELTGQLKFSYTLVEYSYGL